MGLFNREEKRKRLIERNLMDIRYGDFIIYFDEDYEVYAVIEWVEEGYIWKEYKLRKNNEEAYWLNVEIDDGEVLAYFHTLIKDYPVPAQLPDILKYNGKEYKLHDKGNASGKLTSRVGDQFYQCRYYDYKNGNEILSIEDFKADIEVSIGVELIKSQIEILPGG